MSGSNDLLGDLVAEAQQGARGETGALVLLERETEMRNLSKKAKTIIAGAAIAGLASTGVAYAYWTSTGHGSGSASTGTAATWEVTSVNPTDRTGGPLAPGNAAMDQTVAFHVTNNSDGFQQLNQVIISVATSGGGAWSVPPAVPFLLQAACTKADFTLDSASAGDPLTVTINDNLAAGATYDGSVVVHMIDSGAPQDNCRNASVPLYFDAS